MDKAIRDELAKRELELLDLDEDEYDSFNDAFIFIANVECYYDIHKSSIICPNKDSLPLMFTDSDRNLLQKHEIIIDAQHFNPSIDVMTSRFTLPHIQIITTAIRTEKYLVGSLPTNKHDLCIELLILINKIRKHNNERVYNYKISSICHILNIDRSILNDPIPCLYMMFKIICTPALHMNVPLCYNIIS